MNKSRGFTLVEIILVMGLIAALSFFTVISLIRPQMKTSIDLSTETLIADLKEAQLKSMIGDSEGQPTAQNFGIYFGTNSYTIFRGTTYSPSDPGNLVINLSSTETMANTFSGNQVVFGRRSGEVVGFVNGANTITITNDISNQRTITINNLGRIATN